MKLSDGLIFVLLVASIAGAGCIGEEATVSGEEVFAPDFTGKEVLTGDRIELKDYTGEVVLLNFVNYGCSSGLNERVSSQLIEIRGLTEERDDFIPVSVFCGCCPEDVLRDFTTEENFDWPWILDTENTIVPRYSEYIQDYGYPTVVIIDQDQNIRYVGGYTDASALSDKIDELKEVN